jgi:hypothetical protein
MLDKDVRLILEIKSNLKSRKSFDEKRRRRIERTNDKST